MVVYLVLMIKIDLNLFVYYYVMYFYVLVVGGVFGCVGIGKCIVEVEVVWCVWCIGVWMGVVWCS